MRVVSRTLEFRVLGPVEVVYDGVAMRIGSATQRTLLALLLMHPNEVVSTDRLLDVLGRQPDGGPPEALVPRLEAARNARGPRSTG